MALPTLFQRHRERALPARRGDSPLLSLHREMNRMFDDLWRGWELAPAGPFEGGPFMPEVDLEETDTELLVTAELPGLDEKDFDLQLKADRLVLHGEKREERGDRGRGWTERTYGSFHREIPLPCEVDAEKAQAEYKKGVLSVRLPKTPEAREEGRRIEVRTA